MKCRQCAAVIPDGSSFCNRCGAAQVTERPGPTREGPAASQAAEELLWSGRYSLKTTAHLWFLWLLWVAGVTTASVLYVTQHSGTTDLWFLAVGALPALWLLGLALVRKFTRYYRLTSQRLFLQRGFLSRQHDEIELIRVDDVSVRQNLFQRLLAVGQVTVLSTDTTNPRLVIDGVRDPLRLKELIRAQVHARRARTMFLETL